MKKWLCVICGWIFDEAKGWPKDGIVAGTRWEDVPDDWKCPDCGVGKADFEMIEISDAPQPAVQGMADATRPAVPRGPIVIIGSGHAGYSLASAVRRLDPAAELVVLTRESGHLYSKPKLSIATSRGHSVEDLVDESPFMIEKRLGIRIYPRCEVHRIDPDERTVHTSHGALAYGQLVLALGARPIRPQVAGRADAMLSINNLEDYAALQLQLQGAGRVAIIGAGLIGCEFANDLALSGIHVSMIGTGGWPLERLLPEAAGAHLQQALSARGVDWHLATSVTGITGRPGAWKIELANGDTLEASTVISAIGLEPNTDLARGCGIEVGRGIRTDNHLRTSVPGIHALGDCIEIDGRPAPYLSPINHGVEALARTLTGQATEVSYPLMPVQVKTPSAPLSLLPPPVTIVGEWDHTMTTDGMVCAYRDDAGKMHGFALIGEEAQAQRRNYLSKCGRQTTQEPI